MAGSLGVVERGVAIIEAMVIDMNEAPVRAGTHTGVALAPILARSTRAHPALA